MPEFETGQLWITATGRTVEVVAVDSVASGEWGDEVEVDVVAYRFVGGSVTHLRSVHGASSWQKVNTG